MDDGDFGRLIYLGLLLVAVGGWVLVEYRGRLGFALRTAMAWGLIFVGVMAGYGLWNDLRQAEAPQQMMAEGGGVVLPRAADGHYYLTLTIDGTELEFLVDTGATSVVLSQDDARKLGIDPVSLAYLGEATTANGTVRTARVTLTDVVLGDVVDARLPAYVNDGQMDGSLLGMEYLGRFRIEIDGDRMVLTR
jgi:aspartyl protease family protein